MSLMVVGSLFRGYTQLSFILSQNILYIHIIYLYNVFYLQFIYTYIHIIWLYIYIYTVDDELNEAPPISLRPSYNL